MRKSRKIVPRPAQATLRLGILTALALGLVLGGALKQGLDSPSLAWTFSSIPFETATLQPTAEPTLPPSLNTTELGHFLSKYGFDPPGNIRPLAKDEQQRLTVMLPYALAATARYDARYQAQVEPELLLWWTHAEGIGARINYSNCANEAPPAGQSFFSAVMNCDRPDFWQLGYGNQFGNIWVLKEAFTQMHGDPNDPALVQRVGQAVLESDRVARYRSNVRWLFLYLPGDDDRSDHGRCPLARFRPSGNGVQLVGLGALARSRDQLVHAGAGAEQL